MRGGKSKIKTITFVGDSIMAQMANSFVSLLGGANTELACTENHHTSMSSPQKEY